MAGLKVLLTNRALIRRSGTELYLRDVARGLLRRGHTPILYSPRLGETAEALRRETLPVVDSLDRLAGPPDLIHGQHHVETMSALLYFPRVPAVFFCHGWAPWEETPPRFPRILRYVAVDEPSRDRLLWEHGIPEERVRMLLNFVDLDRFHPRPPLPGRPRRALLFSNYASEATHLGPVREACRRAGLELDVVGRAAGRSTDSPEDCLGNYDLVFAKGRCALEAMAVGAAVVLCDAPGAGPLVTSGDLPRLRRQNFGLRALDQPVTAQWLVEQIGRYDAEDAAAVSERIRLEAGLEPALDALVEQYEEVLREHRSLPEPDRDAEGRAAAAYLREAVELFRGHHEAARRALDAIAESPMERARLRLSKLPVVAPVLRLVVRRLGR